MSDGDPSEASYRVWGEATSPWLCGLVTFGGVAAATGAVVLALTATAEASEPRRPSVAAAIGTASVSATAAPIVAPPPPKTTPCAPIIVAFAYAASSLEKADEATLEALAESLKDEPGATLLVHGHADAYGKEDANLALSKARAATVATRLAAHGIDRARMTTRGFGAYQPVEGAPEEAASNRRVAIYVKGTKTCKGETR